MNNGYFLKIIWFISVIFIFIGCSSDSSQTSNRLSGQVIDGYIKDATVCIDVNNNAVCDSDEPYSKSDENGSFVLKLDKPYSGIYTLLSKGGVDTATNELFVGTLSNVIKIDSDATELTARMTPLTTLAVMIANMKAISIDDAKAEVAQTLGLDVADIDADPMKNAKVFEQTQIVVQSSKKIVQVILGNDSSIDINNTFDIVMQKIAEDISDNPTQKDINISSVISAVSEATSVEITQESAVDIESSIDAVKEILSENSDTEDFATLQNSVDINIVVKSTPVFTSSATTEIDENQLNVMTAHATDAEGNLLIYTLSGTDASYFTINSVTGEIKLKEPLDYEATSKHTYNFDVEASNGVNNARQAISVTLKNVYEAPTLDLDSNTTGTGYVTTFTEGDAFVKCDGDVVIKTDENSSLQSATIKLTNAQPDDSLYIDASSEFQIDIDNRQATDSEIVVTITGEASPLQYAQEIASLQFSNSSDNPSTQQRHVEISVNDGRSNSLPVLYNIDIQAVDDAPVTEDANLSVHFNLSLNDIRNSITINMLDYISDPDSDLNLSSFEVTGEPSHGDLNCSDLVCTYTPDLDYDGNDTFAYTIADIEGLQSDGHSLFKVEKYGALQLVINSNTSSFTIPVDSDLEYNYNIDCDSDGEYDDVNVTGEYTCNVDTNDSVYIISIYGKFPHLTFEDVNCSGLYAVRDWGVVELTDFSYTFYKCNNLYNSYFSEKGPDLSHVTSMHSAFESSDFNASVEDWNVSNIEDMVRVFYHDGSFNQPLNKWDVSHVTTMVKMFETNSSDPSTFNQPIGDWNVSNVKYTSSMFQGAVEFNQSVENWDTSSFKEVDAMFKDASSFSDHDLSDWNVTNVTIHDYFLDGAGPNNIEPNWP